MLFKLFDDWVISCVDRLALQFQMLDKVHYVSLIVRSEIFLLTVATLGATAKHSPDSFMFWLSLFPYVIAWFFVGLASKVLNREKRNWDAGVAERCYRRAMRFRLTLRPLRLFGWFCVVAFGLIPGILALISGDAGLNERLLKLSQIAASTLVINGTSLLFLYIVCASPMLADKDSTATR